MASTTTRPGRKTKMPNPGERASLGLKVTPEIKRKLDLAAKANGRTQSQEAEARLEDSFRDQERATLFEEAIYGSQVAGLLEVLGRALRDVVSATAITRSGAGLADPPVFAQAEAALTTILSALRPGGDQPVAPLIVSYADGEGRPIGPAIAEGILHYVAFGSADSADELAKLGAEARRRLGPEITNALKRRFSNEENR